MSRLGIQHYVIFIGLIIGFIRFMRLKPLFRSLTAFLLITLLVEVATPLRLINFHGNNLWLFNIFNPIEFLYYNWLFYSVTSPTIKKGIAVFGCVYIVAVMINFFAESWKALHIPVFILGSIWMIILSCSYFYKLLHSEEKMNIMSEPFFWISTGLLFFYSGQFIVMAIFKSLIVLKDETLIDIFDTIVCYLNVLLYGCFSISLLCPKATKKHI